MFNVVAGARDGTSGDRARLRALLTPSAEREPAVPTVVDVPRPAPPAPASQVEAAQHPLDAAMELARASMAAVERFQRQAEDVQAEAEAKVSALQQEVQLLNERLRLIMAESGRKEERLRRLQIERDREAEESRALEGVVRQMLAGLRAERAATRAAQENLVKTRAWLSEFERKAETVLAAFPREPKRP